jgi:murein L,D-transpeptidase YcbB/YkuD
MALAEVAMATNDSPGRRSPTGGRTMQRTFCALAIAVLAGCSAHRGSPSDAPAARAEQREAARGIPASELSPEQVRLVQRALADRGYPVELSGVFDAHTRSALTRFQRARGLPGDGTLDNNTLETLGIDPRDVLPVRGTDEKAGGSY